MAKRYNILTNLHKHWDCARKLSFVFGVFVFKLREKCFFASRNFMFPVQKHLYTVQKLLYTVRKLLYTVQKHKNPRGVE